MNFINKLFSCCNCFKPNQYSLIENIEMHENEISSYKLIIDDFDVKKYEPKYKYLNYKFIFKITNEEFVCNHINLIPDQSNNDLKLSYISRQNRRKKDLLSVVGNENYKSYEFNCIKGDNIDFLFEIDFEIEVSVIQNNEVVKYNIFKNCLSVNNIVNMTYIYWNYTDKNKLFLDAIQQSNLWFSKYEVEDENILNINEIYSNQYGVLLGIIKPMMNPLTIN